MEDLEPVIEQALVDYAVPGISIGIVTEGQLVYEKGFGFRDLENNLPANPSTVYAIGSCTKAFTSFLVGSFVEEEMLRWDQPIIDILPQFRLFDSHATEHLTLRDLLAHRSGLPRHDVMWYNSSTMSRSDVVSRLRYLSPCCDIRERHQYNNLMYLTVGYAMEQLSKNSWEDLIEKKILTPLQMHHTYFHIHQVQKDSDFAVPYLEKGGEPLRRMEFRDLSLMGPAGGLSSNVTDLSKWVKLHLNGGVFEGKQLINPTVLQEMYTPQMIDAEPSEPGTFILYTSGLGWFVSSYRGNHCVQHTGMIDGFSSLVGLIPDQDIGIIILSNKNYSKLPYYLSNEMIDRLLNLSSISWLEKGLHTIKKNKKAAEESKKKADLCRKKGTLPSHGLKDFVGNYDHNGYGTIAITEERGKLSMSMNGLKYLLEHWHYDTFVISEEFQDTIWPLEGMKISFHTGSRGEIEKMTIPFEPEVPDISFIKSPMDSFITPDYLKSFVGIYEIHGSPIEISLQKEQLCVIIPGKPQYELIPVIKNEFVVKSLSGFTVRFILNDNLTVNEVLLIHPYGIVFSAHPQK